MAIQMGEEDQPGPNGEKPRALWRSDDGHQLVCPFCDREEPSDDRLGSTSCVITGRRSTTRPTRQATRNDRERVEY